MVKPVLIVSRLERRCGLEVNCVDQACGRIKPRQDRPGFRQARNAMRIIVFRFRTEEFDIEIFLSFPELLMRVRDYCAATTRVLGGEVLSAFNHFVPSQIAVDRKRASARLAPSFFAFEPQTLFRACGAVSFLHPQARQSPLSNVACQLLQVSDLKIAAPYTPTIQHFPPSTPVLLSLVAALCILRADHVQSSALPPSTLLHHVARPSA